MEDEFVFCEIKYKVCIFSKNKVYIMFWSKNTTLWGGSPGLVVMGGDLKLCLKRQKINQKEAGDGPFF